MRCIVERVACRQKPGTGPTLVVADRLQFWVQAGRGPVRFDLCSINRHSALAPPPLASSTKLGPNTPMVSHSVVWVAMKIATISGAGLFDQRATTGRLMRGVRPDCRS